ncbi:MAG TPA: hypothetical protein VN247_08260 [Arenimonas sp.]|nr:hypothetical protein [Arenimonas sp.]
MFLYRAILLSLLLCSAVQAKDVPTWKESGNAYKSKTAVPVQSLALGAVNVDVGVHLERLTLLSGEGHTGKKVASGLLAGALALGGVGGVDTAAREPIEEHLTLDDSKRIAADVAQIVSERFKAMPSMKIYAGEEVTNSEFYKSVAGRVETDDHKLTVKEGRWGAEYYFRYYSVPAGSYKYRPLEKLSFSDKTFSPVVRQSIGVDAVIQFNVFFANTRKDFRIHEMSVKLTGLTWSGQKGGDMPALTFNLENAGAVAVLLEGKEGDKDNYAAWLNLRPQFEAQIDAVVAKIRAAIPVVAMAPAPVAL